MNFAIFYDNRAADGCNTNAAVSGNQPPGQQYGGYYVDQGPAGYHNGALYSDPRISMYIGMGMHQMPGDVWWRTWRTLPPKRCPTDPDFSWQGQWPTPGYWQTYTDPQSGKQFNVWEGHYVYPGHVADVRSHVCRRHVRGPDGQPRRARDDLGPAQLRPRRPALGRGPGDVRDAGPPLSGLGHVAVQHGGRQRELRRLRGRGTRVWPHVSEHQGLGSVHHLRDRGHREPARVGDRAASAAPGMPTRISRRCAACIRASTAPTVASTTRSTRRPARSAIGDSSSTSR